MVRVWACTGGEADVQYFGTHVGECKTRGNVKMAVWEIVVSAEGLFSGPR